MPARDLALLTEAVRGAGRVALGYWRGENRVWHKGEDDPVSEADLAVETYLRQTLTTARPGAGWLSEEAEDSRDRLSADEVFIVDPIDGTRSFVAGKETWAHSVGLMRGGRMVAGAVYLPVSDRLYAAGAGQGATLNGAPIRVSGRGTAEGASVLAPRPSLEPDRWPGGLPALERAFRPSLAYRLCLVAEGRFDAMLTLRACWEWDIAAGALIAAEAGAAASDPEGAALVFNSPDRRTPGAVVATPGVHADLLRGLSGAAAI